jgi:hypothetical protein
VKHDKNGVRFSRQSDRGDEHARGGLSKALIEKPCRPVWKSEHANGFEQPDNVLDIRLVVDTIPTSLVSPRAKMNIGT